MCQFFVVVFCKFIFDYAHSFALSCNDNDTVVKCHQKRIAKSISFNNEDDERTFNDKFYLPLDAF